MRRAQAYAAASALWAIALLGVLPATLTRSELGATALLAGVATVFAIGECIHAVVLGPLIADLAHKLEPDPVTAPVVSWMFGQRLAGHSAARITRALNDAGVPCPSAADPGRNPHRAGSGWTLRMVAAILANPRYTGRQVWNRQPSEAVLVDPANTGLGHRQVQRWNLPEGWVISRHPAHTALVSEADFIAAQDTMAPRGPG
jgi:hypothetical protein